MAPAHQRELQKWIVPNEKLRLKIQIDLYPKKGYALSFVRLKMLNSLGIAHFEPES